MEHMEGVLYCPPTPACMSLLTSDRSAYEQVDIWALICSSFVWNSEHTFSGNQLLAVGFRGWFTNLCLKHNEATVEYD